MKKNSEQLIKWRENVSLSQSQSIIFIGKMFLHLRQQRALIFRGTKYVEFLGLGHPNLSGEF